MSGNGQRKQYRCQTCPGHATYPCTCHGKPMVEYVAATDSEADTLLSALVAAAAAEQNQRRSRRPITKPPASAAAEPPAPLPPNL